VDHSVRLKATENIVHGRAVAYGGFDEGIEGLLSIFTKDFNAEA